MTEDRKCKKMEDQKVLFSTKYCRGKTTSIYPERTGTEDRIRRTESMKNRRTELLTEGPNK